MNIDERLLANYPLLWASRIFYTLLITCILLVVNCCMAAFVRVDAGHIPVPSLILVYSTVICVIIASLWAYYQVMINYRYHHGRTGKWHELAVTSLFILQIGLYTSTIFLPYLILDQRIRSAVLDPALGDVGRLTYYSPVDGFPIGHDSIVIDVDQDTSNHKAAEFTYPFNVYYLVNRGHYYFAPGKGMSLYKGDSVFLFNWGQIKEREDTLYLKPVFTSYSRSPKFNVDIVNEKYKLALTDTVEYLAISSIYDSASHRRYFVESFDLYDMLLSRSMHDFLLRRDPGWDKKELYDHCQGLIGNLNDLLDYRPAALLSTIIFWIVLFAYFVIILSCQIRLFGWKSVFLGLILPFVVLVWSIYGSGTFPGSSTTTPYLWMYEYFIYLGALAIFLFIIVRRGNAVGLALIQFFFLFFPLAGRLIYSSIPDDTTKTTEYTAVDALYCLSLVVLIPVFTYRLYRLYCMPAR